MFRSFRLLQEICLAHVYILKLTDEDNRHMWGEVSYFGIPFRYYILVACLARY